jgi:chromosome segregation ATPase
MAPTGKENDSDNATLSRKTRGGNAKSKTANSKPKETATSQVLRDHETLKDQYEALHSEYTALKDELTELEAGRKTQQKEHDKLENDLLKLQAKFGKTDGQNARLKQDLAQQKTKTERLTFEAEKAKTEIAALGGGIKLATLENENTRLKKDNDQHVLDLAVIAVQKDLLLKSNKATLDDSALLKKQLLAKEKQYSTLQSNNELAKQEAKSKPYRRNPFAIVCSNAIEKAKESLIPSVR